MKKAGVREHLWEKVWNNLKCLKKCAFQCIKSLKIGVLWRAEKVWNQIKYELSHPWESKIEIFLFEVHIINIKIRLWQ